MSAVRIGADGPNDPNLLAGEIKLIARIVDTRPESSSLFLDEMYRLIRRIRALRSSRAAFGHQCSSMKTADGACNVVKRDRHKRFDHLSYIDQSAQLRAALNTVIHSKHES